jgi:hypothetical protein
MDVALNPIGRLLTVWTLLASLLAGCVTTGLGSSIPDSELTPSQIAMRERNEALNRTLWEGAAWGALIGAAAGALLSENRAAGALAGGAAGGLLGATAGNYVSSRQREAGNRLDALETMVVDVRKKNGEASAAIRSMEAVVAENRRKLTAMNAKYRKGAISEADYRRHLEIVQEDREEILNAAEQTRKQAETFKEAESTYKTQNPDVNTNRFGTEIAALSAKSSAMTRLAEGLADERLGS